MQFMIIAYDGTDEGAPGRRMAAREEHLDWEGAWLGMGTCSMRQQYLMMEAE